MVKKIILAKIVKNDILTESSDEAVELKNKSCYGELLKNKQVKLPFIEAVYLLEKGAIKLINGRNQEVTFEKIMQKASKAEKDFFTRYSVFKDMRNRGYIVKSALKFGADFRVYDRGIKPGEDHAKWVLFPVNESNSLTWYDFSSKVRVAHSTRKRLLIGIVDHEGDVTYYEIKWTRP